jgi:hypothetical protein
MAQLLCSIRGIYLELCKPFNDLKQAPHLAYSSVMSGYQVQPQLLDRHC